MIYENCTNSHKFVIDNVILFGCQQRPLLGLKKHLLLREASSISIVRICTNVDRLYNLVYKRHLIKVSLPQIFNHCYTLWWHFDHWNQKTWTDLIACWSSPSEKAIFNDNMCHKSWACSISRYMALFCNLLKKFEPFEMILTVSPSYQGTLSFTAQGPTSLKLSSMFQHVLAETNWNFIARSTPGAGNENSRNLFMTQKKIPKKKIINFL